MTITHAPAGEAEIADCVREAAAAGTPLEIRGGGTRLAIGRPVQTGATLSLAEHRGITLYEPGALTLVAKAGTPMAEIEAALAAEGQQLAFEPMDHRPLLGSEGAPTIGAVVACNISGPRRVQAGACRDSLLGLRFVDGAGTVMKNGGRVMKNVTGYDLCKLLCGAYGTLGVLTEVSLKVLPAPERALTLALRGLGPAAAVEAMAAALGSPYEVSGAAHLTDGAEGAMTLLRIEGFESQVRHRAERLCALLAGRGAVERIEGERHGALWRAVRDVEPFAGDARAVWRLSLRPGDAPAVAARLGDEAGADCLFDWGGGLVWAAVPEAADAHAPALRAAVAATGGHATLVRAPAAVRAAVPVFQPEAARLADLSRALRARFDPAGVLNPGRMAA